MQGMVARKLTKEIAKDKTKMGDRHHRYVWYDGNSNQSGGRQAPISQRRLGSGVPKRISSEKRRS